MSWPLLGAAITPSLLIFWYFAARDLNPEPSSILRRTFFYGVLTTIPAVFLELGEGALTGTKALPPVAASLNDAFLSAALVEELLKFSVLYFYARRQQAFDEPMDGIIYGVTASLGFATLENVLYVAEHGMGTAIVRAIFAVPGHAVYGALMGYFVGQAQFGDQQARGRNLALALLVPIGLHGLYDFPLMLLDKSQQIGVLILVPVAVVAGAWMVVRKLVLRLHAEQVQLARQGVVPTEPLPQPEPKRTLGAWLQLIIGGALASWGGMVALGLVVILVDDKPDPNLPNILIGCAIIGLLPLVLGLALFRAGLRPSSSPQFAASSPN